MAASPGQGVWGGLLVAALGIAGFWTQALGQELLYKPLNPSFGGNPFNSAHLLSLADRQNQFKETPDPFDRFQQSSTDQFQRQIQSALLGRVSSQIADQILGEDAADSGRFSIDSTEISFERIDGVISISISDGISGGSTVIRIPVPVY